MPRRKRAGIRECALGFSVESIARNVTELHIRKIDDLVPRRSSIAS